MSATNTPIPSEFSEVRILDRKGNRWIASPDLASALGYADTSAVTRIYRRHVDEFTPGMKGSVKLTGPRGPQSTMIFSLRGAHLVAMFAKTEQAKGFRRWVLDLIERDFASSDVAKISTPPAPDLTGMSQMQLFARVGDLDRVSRVLPDHAAWAQGEMQRATDALIAMPVERPIDIEMGVSAALTAHGASYELRQAVEAATRHVHDLTRRARRPFTPRQEVVTS